MVLKVKSVRASLLTLVALCVLLATGALALVVWQADQLSRRQSMAQAQETAQALSQAVDGQLERAKGVLAALSASRAVHNQEWQVVDHQARSAFPDRDAWIVVQDRRGRQLVNTSLAVGAPLPWAAPPVEMWRSLDAGRNHICDLVQGVVQRQITCVDVGLNSSPKPQQAMSVIYKPQMFQSIITRSNVRDGQLASLVDRNGTIIWRNIRPEYFVGRKASGTMRQRLNAPENEGAAESTSLDGVRMLSAYHRSSLSGWAVIVGVPLSEVRAAVQPSLLRGGFMLLALFLFSALLAAALGRRLNNGLKVLTRAVDADRTGQPVLSTGLTEFDAAALALHESAAARSRSERHQQILIGELNHRVKNTLTVVQSLAHQTFRGRCNPEQLIQSFEARLQALATAHNLLTRSGWESAPMSDVVKGALKPFCGPDRCRIEGSDFSLPPQTAVNLALALHELATNAVKYGALSVPTGRVLVQWSTAPGRFEFDWEESGGPPVQPSGSEGFGTRLIKRTLASELKGEVDMDFAPSGLRCRLIGSLPPEPDPLQPGVAEGVAAAVTT